PLVLLGRWDEALESVADLEAGGTVGPGDAQLLVHIAEVECWRGQAAQARARLDRYVASIDPEDMQSLSAFALHEAMVRRAEGKPQAALEAVELDLAHVLEELGVTFVTVKLSLVEALEAAF